MRWFLGGSASYVWWNCALLQEQGINDESHASNIKQNSVIRDSQKQNDKHSVRHTHGNFDLRTDELIKEIIDWSAITEDDIRPIVRAVNRRPAGLELRNPQTIRDRRAMELDSTQTLANI